VWNAWERREKLHKVLAEKPKGKNQSEDQSVDERMGSEWILGRLAGGGGGAEWIQLARVRGQWWAVVNVVMNPQVLAPWS
jgi:hypothetical protein